MISPLVEHLIPGLIEQGRGLAWRAFHRAPHVLDREELESIACEGLIDAASKWEAYCARRGFSPESVEYFGAYAMRRMNGSILDFLRSNDWVTRSVRQRAKRIQEAGPGLTYAELAERTGLTVEQVRQTEAGVACKPVSLDEGEREIPEARDVEAEAGMRLLLEQVAAVQHRLAPAVRVVLALRYFEGMELPGVAEVLGLALAEAAQLHDEGVLAVYDSVLTAVA